MAFRLVALTSISYWYGTQGQVFPSVERILDERSGNHLNGIKHNPLRPIPCHRRHGARVSPALCVYPSIFVCGRRARLSPDNPKWVRAKDRATPQQLALNKKIVACTSSEQILQLLESALEEGTDLNGVNMATAVSRYARVARGDAKADPRFSTFLDLVWAEIREAPDSFQSRHLSNLAHGLAKLGGPEAEKGLAVLETEMLRRGWRDFDPQGFSNTAWGFATAGQGSVQLFEGIEKELLARKFAGFNPQNAANTLWAFATAGRGGAEFYHAAEAMVAQSGLEGCNAQDIANILWAFATAGRGSESLFSVMEVMIISRGLDDFTPQGVSNTIWAFAKGGYRGPRIYAAVEEEALVGGLFGFKPQNIVNLAWAFATACMGSPALFSVIESRVVAMGTTRFKAQELANLLWAFATAGHPGRALFAAVEAGLTPESMASFNLQNCANALWAFAVADRCHRPVTRTLMDKALSYVAWDMPVENLVQLAQFVLAAGYTAHPGRPRGDGDAPASLPGLFNGHSSSRRVGSYASSERVGSPSSNNRLNGENGGQAAHGPNHQASHPLSGDNGGQARATAGYTSQGGEPHVVARDPAGGSRGHPVGRRGEEAVYSGSARNGYHVKGARINGRDVSAHAGGEGLLMMPARGDAGTAAIASSSGSATATGRDVIIGSSGGSEVGSGLGSSESTSSNRINGSSSVGGDIRREGSGEGRMDRGREGHGELEQDRELDGMAAALVLEAVRTATERGRIPSPPSSRLHQEVSGVLTDMAIQHTNELPLFGGVYYVDIAVAGKIAVEVDGPCHFRGGPQALSGDITSTTALKRRLLEQGGWTILSVPYFEWTMLSDSGQKQRYMRGKLVGCGAGALVGGVAAGGGANGAGGAPMRLQGGGEARRSPAAELAQE
eukprot:jgi/Mesvir1/3441/Mv11937-RA.1